MALLLILYFYPEESNFVQLLTISSTTLYGCMFISFIVYWKMRIKYDLLKGRWFSSGWLVIMSEAYFVWPAFS